MRMPIGATVVLVLLTLSPLIALAGGEGVPVVAYTNDSSVVADSAAVLKGMSWTRYREVTQGFSRFKAFVVLKDPLPDSGEQVVYGINAVLPVGNSENIRNLSWALSVSDDTPRRLIVDLNGNGLLSDEVPMEFKKGESDDFWAVGALTVDDTAAENGILTIPLRWVVEKTATSMMLKRYEWRERIGKVTLDGKTYEFSLRTPLATYDAAGALFGIDLDQDGEVRFRDADAEVFRVDDGTLVIDGNEYRFSVDRLGRYVSFTRTGRRAAARARLTVGTAAPTLPDRLARAAGSSSPIFLNFWSPKCSFSRRMEPQLNDALRDLGGKVRFVAVARERTGDRVEGVGIVGASENDWLRVGGKEGETLFQLFRVDEVPTYYVIDAEGIIRARGTTMDWKKIRDVLDALASNGR